MDNSEKILIRKEIIEIINVKLKSLKLITSDKEVKKEIDNILELLIEEFESNNTNFRDLLDEKIKETKYSDPELNFKLYMLYRKLEDGKISEEEAVKGYDLYISGHAGEF